jgi:hypothetical protein
MHYDTIYLVADALDEPLLACLPPLLALCVDKNFSALALHWSLAFFFSLKLITTSATIALKLCWSTLNYFLEGLQ